MGREIGSQPGRGPGSISHPAANGETAESKLSREEIPRFKMAGNNQREEPIFPKETVESFSGDLLLINKVMQISLTMGERLRDWERRWSAERRAWGEERAKLNARIAELEESHVGNSAETNMAKAGHAGESMKKGEKLREGIDTPINEVRWEEELEERKRTAKKIVIASMDIKIDKKRVLEVLRQKLGRKMEEGRVEERACGDGITRWHAKLESADEAHKILVEEAALRREFKIKVSPESTYIQRQTRLIVEKRAEAEKMACKEAKVKTDSPWIGIDDKWERWLEKEARWISEEEWASLRRREEIRRAEKRLERLRREEEREAARAES